MLNYKYCLFCGGKLKAKGEHFRCTKCNKMTFVNSYPSAGVYLVNKDKVLLAKRKTNPNKGTYDVIGGFLKRAEHPRTAAVRETKEETGLTVEIIDFLGHYIDEYDYKDDVYDGLVIIYVGKIISGKQKPNDDVESVRWFPIRKPPENVAFRCVKKSLEDLQKWYKKSSGT